MRNKIQNGKYICPETIFPHTSRYFLAMAAQGLEKGPNCRIPYLEQNKRIIRPTNQVKIKPGIKTSRILFNT